MADAWADFDGVPGGAPAPAPVAADPRWSAFDGTPQAATPQPITAAPVAAPPAPSDASDSLGRRLGLGVRDVVEGVAGPIYNAAAYPFQKLGLPVNTLGENLTSLGLPQPETPSERMTSAVIQPVAGTLTGQGAGRAMATMANPLMAGIGETLASQPAMQALSAGAGGAAQEATGSPTAGLAAALAVPLGTASLGRVLSPNILGSSPERAAAIETLRQERVPFSIAQATGGKVARNMEDTLAKLAGSSGVQARENAVQQQAWNRAVMARTGTPSTTALPEDLRAARGNISATYQDLTARNTLQADPQFLTQVRDVAANVNRYVPESERGPLNARIEDVVNGLENGNMPGRTYQNLYSALGDDIRSTSDGKTRQFMGKLRDALRNAMDRSISPEDQEAWQMVRRQHANLQTVAKAMNRPSEGTALGDVSFASLAQAGNNAPTKSFAFGRGNMDDLARAGQAVLKQTVPDSGTSQRTAMANMLTGKSLVPALATSMMTGTNPLYALAAPVAEVGLPYLASQAYHSRALRNYLMNDIFSGITPQAGPLLGSAVAQNQLGRLRDR